VDLQLFDITYVSAHSPTSPAPPQLKRNKKSTSQVTSWTRVPQVKCGDPSVDKKVSEKVNQFCAWVDKHPGKKGQVGCLCTFRTLRRLSLHFTFITLRRAKPLGYP
jgi:hypothetical protein